MAQIGFENPFYFRSLSEENTMSSSRSKMAMFAVATAGLIASNAIAGYTITQGTSAPTYSTTLNFDELGGPVGVGLPTDSWLGSHGVTELQAGDGVPVVDDFSGVFPWVNDGNAFFGNFGVFMKLDSDVTEFSTQVWDPSGAPSPFGGGFGVFLFNDGGATEVASYFGEPAWGGIGDEWINVTTDSGSVFDEIRILGFGFGPTTLADNMSWNAVPEPATLSLLAIGALAIVRRRRA